MNTTFFKTLTFCLLIALITSATSCSDVFSVDFTKQESIDKLKEKLAKDLPENAVITSMVFMHTSNFTSDMDLASVIYYLPGEEKPHKINISLGQGEPRESNTTSFDEKIKAEDGKPLADIDISQIASNVQKGADIMASEDINMPFSGIGMYTITMNADPQKVTHKFSLQSKGETKATTKNGRLGTETEYYEFDFEADATGNVTLKG